jgi:DNA-binding MarR family transcriptional regulator
MKSMNEISDGLRIIRLLRYVMDTMKQNVEQHFKQLQLTGPQGILLGILSQHSKMKISELSEKLGLSNSTVSGIIDRLEKQNLVERIRSDEDRRVVYASVTEDAKHKFKECFDKTEKLLEGMMMKKATKEEIDLILSGLNTLKQVLDRQ